MVVFPVHDGRYRLVYVHHGLTMATTQTVTSQAKTMLHSLLEMMCPKQKPDCKE